MVSVSVLKTHEMAGIMAKDFTCSTETGKNVTFNSAGNSINRRSHSTTNRNNSRCNTNSSNSNSNSNSSNNNCNSISSSNNSRSNNNNSGNNSNNSRSNSSGEESSSMTTHNPLEILVAGTTCESEATATSSSSYSPVSAGGGGEGRMKAGYAAVAAPAGAGADAPAPAAAGAYLPPGGGEGASYSSSSSYAKGGGTSTSSETNESADAGAAVVVGARDSSRDVVAGADSVKLNIRSGRGAKAPANRRTTTKATRTRTTTTMKGERKFAAGVAATHGKSKKGAATTFRVENRSEDDTNDMHVDTKSSKRKEEEEEGEGGRGGGEGGGGGEEDADEEEQDEENVRERNEEGDRRMRKEGRGRDTSYEREQEKQEEERKSRREEQLGANFKKEEEEKEKEKEEGQSLQDEDLEWEDEEEKEENDDEEGNISYEEKEEEEEGDLKEEGLRHFNKENYEAAIRCWQRGLRAVCFVLAKDLRDPPKVKEFQDMKRSYLLNLSLACLKAERYGECVTYCDEVLAMEPHHLKALYRKSQALRSRSLLQEALDTLEMLLQQHEGNPAALALQQQVRREMYVHRKREKHMAQAILQGLEADARSQAAVERRVQEQGASLSGWLEKTKNFLSTGLLGSSVSSFPSSYGDGLAAIQQQQQRNVVGGEERRPSKKKEEEEQQRQQGEAGATELLRLLGSVSQEQHAAGAFDTDNTQRGPWGNWLQKMTAAARSCNAMRPEERPEALFGECGGDPASAAAAMASLSSVFSGQQQRRQSQQEDGRRYDVVDGLASRRDAWQQQTNLEQLQQLLQLHEALEKGGRDPRWWKRLFCKARFCVALCGFVGKVVYRNACDTCKRRMRQRGWHNGVSAVSADSRSTGTGETVRRKTTRRSNGCDRDEDAQEGRVMKVGRSLALRRRAVRQRPLQTNTHHPNKPTSSSSSSKQTRQHAASSNSRSSGTSSSRRAAQTQY